MSHITRLKTSITKRFILKEALINLELPWTELEYDSNEVVEKTNPRLEFAILQDNGSDITFLWNGSEYEVGIDISQWQQNRSIAGFMSTVEQTYAWTLLHVSADTVGFTPNEQESNESQVKNKPKKLEIVENEQQILICKGWGK
jgi:hypothetical protein